MAKSYSLSIGGRKVQLSLSTRQVAVRPNLGMAKAMGNELRALAKRVLLKRRARLEGYEILDIDAPPQELSLARATLRDAPSVEQQVGVYHTSSDRVPFIPAGTIYMSFKPGLSDEAKQSVLDKYGLERVASEPNDFLTVRVTTAGTDAVEVASKLQDEGSVAVAEPDLVTAKRAQALVLPGDALLAREWHLENTGMLNGQPNGKQGADARVVAAWKVLDSLGSSHVVVGIIDDGFDLSHPDLVDKAVHPFDFGRSSSDVRPEADPIAPGKGNWHGTACAGVAVGKAEGGLVIGAAPNAKLLPVRMNDSLSPEHVVKWFDYMTDQGAWVVSCSWGADAKVYPLPTRIAHAISRCAKEGRNGKGCVVLFAAGNSTMHVNDPPNSQNGLATHPDVIAVTACTSADTHADYSNFGDEIWICAPSGGLGGRNIITADVTDGAGAGQNSGYAPGDYYEGFTGTSSACPLVAGVCALVLGANPELTSAEVREIIKSTARKIGPQEEYRDGHSIRFGYGCVDAESAVKEALRRAGGSGNDSATPLVAMA